MKNTKCFLSVEIRFKLHNAEDEYGMEHPYTNVVRAEFVGAYNIIEFGGLLDEYHKYMMLHKYGINIKV